MVLKGNSAAKLLYYHLADRKAKAYTILVDIIFYIELVKHFPNGTRILETDSLVSDADFKSLNARFIMFVLAITSLIV